ncbi:homolog to phage integrase [Natronomonas moolapensis 8.8.11]|uniref:Homolog to phage integrase n=1 Tax=Natronomonas moolapensis (strain DSM 18674 / CECT 7526 / JCM 14361 / 8.8.11) TaxID=268739 RepID=M1XPG9_NATM8|nr:tyrosine-type recombinase/integrase [Natronomonas moolapensis]CCQ35929.1 homolog to phage integrase [Natronomonas moolapensis 8.8.11]
MQYSEYEQKAQQRYAEATLQDRKSCIRLFDVYLAGYHTERLSGKEAVQRFRDLKRTTRGSYQFSEHDPESFEQVTEFISLLFDLDDSRNMIRHYFDSIQSYCDEMNLEWFDEREFRKYRERRFKHSGTETVYGLAADDRNVYHLGEVETILENAESPYREFFAIQYLHCRRPGEVLLLEASDVRLEDDLVWYHILKQQRGEDNREYVQVRNDVERELLKELTHGEEGKLFDITLNEIRDELRRVQQDRGIPQLKLKNFRHTRVSHLKAAGWSDVQIRDEYTKHKHLSTLQDKYMSYVPEEISENDLWRVIAVETADSNNISVADAEVMNIIKKYEF